MPRFQTYLLVVVKGLILDIFSSKAGFVKGSHKLNKFLLFIKFIKFTPIVNTIVKLLTNVTLDKIN